MVATPDLLGVPPEVFERIAQLADDSDLPALRLTSRDAASKVLRTFVDAHFTHRHILVTEVQNLRTAIEVAKHPVFGPALNTIWLYVDEVQPDTDPDFPAFYNKQRALMNGDRDLHLLTGLFAHLKAHGVRPDIRVSPVAPPVHHKLHVPPDFGTSHFGICMWHVLEAPEKTDSRPFLKVMKALSLSLLEPFALHVFEDTCNVVTSHLTDQHLTYMAQALRGVKTLQLSTLALVDDGSHSERIGKFCSLLSNELDLTDLLLHVEHRTSCYHADEIVVVRELFKKQFASLRTLQLDGPRLEEGAFLDFIHRHPTIHTLELNHVFPFNEADPDKMLSEVEFDAVLQQLTTVTEISVGEIV